MGEGILKKEGAEYKGIWLQFIGPETPKSKKLARGIQGYISGTNRVATC
jgi:hypothetical protein